MRILILLTLAALLAAPVGAQTVFVSPDVPTRPDGPTTYLPWDVVRHGTVGPPYALSLTIPGTPAIDALHRMDAAGNWLFSVGASNNLAGNLPNPAEPRDVIRWDVPNAVYTLFFDGGSVLGAVPISTRVDALYLDKDDFGDLIVSFDVTTTIGPNTFRPSELVRYTRVGPLASDWQLVGPEFDFASTPQFAPRHANVTGADRVAGEWVVALDIPTRLGPWLPAPPPVGKPGQLVSWDGAAWDLAFDLQAAGVPGWPNRVEVDALTCQANPGRIDPNAAQILLDRTGADITLFCPGSCSSGGQAYGLYEGTLGVYYSHAQVPGNCQRTCPGNFLFAQSVGSSYYLLVPHNQKEEGSYGRDSNGIERPQPPAAADRCVEVQTLSQCP